ncbi:hypothetical protein EVG20_g6752 [Dentipellis fragilis]|uniref:N-acetyltransferase domain-containing protein n=1 Tax=Dentipellis fragilis TaxID=205917 RepID=A0A4Y9YK11_9AGAM|nr:hypothetical protein EVG20_g6752 [Dentipellis fragilis]
MASSLTVRQLTAPDDAEHQHMIALLEETFANDTAIRCVTGGSKDNRRAWCKLLIDKTLREGQLWAAGFNGRIDALAFWFGPGVESAIAESNEYAAMLTEDMRDWMNLHYRPQYQELYRSTYATGSRVRIQAWHLKIIAVRLSHQRQGLGRALVAVVTEKADRDTVAMTTDTTTSNALYFLQRLGFRYIGVKNFVMQRYGFPMWCMIREPPTSSSYY